MRLVFGLVLVLGLGLAGFAVYMAKSYIQRYQAELAHERANRDPGIDTIEVYVAATPLKYGQELNLEDVRLTPFPAMSLPEGVFETQEALFPRGEGVPRTVLRSIEANEAILAVKVTAPGEEAGITSQLERGMRAFAINVDVSSGVSGFLRPGDRVDIYWTGQAANTSGAQLEGRGAKDVTKLIETNVKLIAVDQEANADTNEAIIARTVTVSARPQQVASLAQAQSTGQLSLSLVGAEDDSVAEAIEVDQRSLLGIEEQVVESAPIEQQVCTIRTRRGAEVIETPIPCTN
ncbi:Flp pilus assembly protein CpaB [Roseovarius indicus]|uniref:Pilus assembly protein CpaB n=1 Tax=Roseovarius indicus TaxID=540747 RepID=A0A0T5P5Q9_9RHOB|nr:Flp pilus assembly protein CpaB [Roseovarius indicus]KRS16523.1 pilus assembly protein CpaB [Roseovarius indicus]OAO10346.1 Flp pilus assembly protein CpaB [Roseovarius indicus]QEW28171.1 Flp pilus assembly protein CpaB [Roseovarius indicus]SFE55611.1 pilus assembly protein CpaB [Roseovarius indicus]